MARRWQDSAADVAERVAAYALAEIPYPTAPLPLDVDMSDPIARFFAGGTALPRERARTEDDAERLRDDADREPLDGWAASRRADRYEAMIYGG